MITDTLRFSGLTTKIKAMSSKIFTTEDYSKISNLTSVLDFVVLLKSNPSYGKLFESVDEHNVRRSEIERIISRSIFDDYIKIYKFSSTQQRSFLKLIIMKHEVFILKHCLRIVFNHEDVPSFFAATGDFFLRYSNLDINLLLSSKDIGEFINNLKDSDYYDIFEKLQITNHETLFDYEVRLDIHFFTKLWKQKDKLFKGKELDVITKTFGSEIDLLNIMWIYRSKKYYNINSANIYTYIIPVNFKLKKGDLNALIEAPDIEEFINVLKNTYYVKVYGELGSDQIEILYNNILDKLYKKFQLKYPYSVAIVNNYFYTKQKEINNLITALECIRYGLSPNEIMAYTTNTVHDLA